MILRTQYARFSHRDYEKKKKKKVKSYVKSYVYILIDANIEGAAHSNSGGFDFLVVRFDAAE